MRVEWAKSLARAERWEEEFRELADEHGFADVDRFLWPLPCPEVRRARSAILVLQSAMQRSAVHLDRARLHGVNAFVILLQINMAPDNSSRRVAPGP